MVRPHPSLHPSFLAFREDEWLPALAAYLAEEERYICFPRGGLIASWGDPGVHFDNRTDWFLAPVQIRGGDYRLPSLDESMAVYDAFFELMPPRLAALAPSLPDACFDVDLNATKGPNNMKHERVLTTRPVREAEASYGLRNQSTRAQCDPGASRERDKDGAPQGCALGCVGRGWRRAEDWRRSPGPRRHSSRRRSLAYLLARGFELVRRIGHSLRLRRHE